MTHSLKVAVPVFSTKINRTGAGQPILIHCYSFVSIHSGRDHHFVRTIVLYNSQASIET